MTIYISTMGKSEMSQSKPRRNINAKGNQASAKLLEKIDKASGDAFSYRCYDCDERIYFEFGTRLPHTCRVDYPDEEHFEQGGKLASPYDTPNKSANTR